MYLKMLLIKTLLPALWFKSDCYDTKLNTRIIPLKTNLTKTKSISPTICFGTCHNLCKKKNTSQEQQSLKIDTCLLLMLSF